VAQSPPVYPTGAEYYPVYSEFVSWDELHTLTGRNIGAIIHLAGKAHDTHNTVAEQEYFDNEKNNCSKSKKRFKEF
jgi:hypothetical protein